MARKNNLTGFNCPACKWQGERSPNLKKCPECGEPVVRTAYKTGKQRKAKRRAKKVAEAELISKHGEVWGTGHVYEEKRNNKLVKQSLRWDTEKTHRELETVLDPKELKAKEIAVLVTQRNMLSQDPAVSNAAVRNLVSMEGQNQKDDQGREPERHQHLHLHEENPYLNAPMETIIEAKVALAKLAEQGEPDE
jgi:ribosomal protein L32